MLDFPNAPTVGQKYPAPPIVGVPVYSWDGAKWVASGSGFASAIYSDTPPTGVADGTLWWESDTGLMYVRYNDGNSTQWVIACPQPDTSTFVLSAGSTMSGPLVLSADPTATLGAATKQYVDTRVRYDAAQALTVPQQIQARQNIFASPLDALAYNGMQINGAFDVSQELGLNTGATTSGLYGCDGWQLQKIGTSAVTLAAFNAPQFIAGFQNLLIITIQTAQATLSATDFVSARGVIEGYRVARLNWGTANAQPLTIAFWSSHVLPGLYTGTIRNSGGTRSFAFSYTHAIANVAQYNIITIPGDTAGTWLVTNGLGLDICLTHACGTTYSAPSFGNWLSGNYVAGPGQVNGVASTANNFRIAGFMALPGIEAAFPRSRAIHHAAIRSRADAVQAVFQFLLVGRPNWLRCKLRLPSCVMGTADARGSEHYSS